jgi:hypothetical protein
MPIEIKELHIKINVNDKPQASNPEKNSKDEKEAIVAACVEQVMEILSKTQER